MSRWNWIKVFFAFIWPWIVKYLWPVIQKHILDIFDKIARRARSTMDEWMETRKRTGEEMAQKKAAEAELNAHNASTDAEADKQRAIAQAWREAAEQFRQENEELKTKLNDVLKKSESGFKDDMQAMDIEGLIEEADGASVKVKGSDTVLRLPEPTETPQITLYERLGGGYAIASVVDDFIDRIMEDPRLNSNPHVNEAHHKVSRAGFKYLVTEQVCEATGGPQHYTGRSMYDSHVHLEIKEQEWQAFLDDFKQTLDKFSVPGAEQAELFAIVESTKKDIVVTGKS